ncbi:uncharacterized protein LOC115008767 isoform X2 [Cottoperca gobio]|nr:uncharacterized protein LOC115008767 isoform X2 [Cottoperca gobio]XP_029288425.1 uncharacterized protein LOC115008767 isoform X2 [Cottoperca gobio]
MKKKGKIGRKVGQEVLRSHTTGIQETQLQRQTDYRSLIINIMKSFILLILSLMTVCEVSSKGKGRKEDRCKPSSGEGSDSKGQDKVKVVCEVSSKERGRKEDRYKPSSGEGSDSKGQDKVKVVCEVSSKGKGRKEDRYKPSSGEGSDSKGQDKVKVDYSCKESFIQTAYRTAKTTITCECKGKKHSTVECFCKVEGSTCQDILSINSSLKSNGTFTLTENQSGFSVSISNVSSQHAGVYRCGVETTQGRNRAQYRSIQLKVEATITNFTRTPTSGETFTYWCRYPEGDRKNKFICKGEDPSICEPLVRTTKPNNERFSMKDDSKGNITITVRDVTAEDTGTYWCGAQSTNKEQSNSFFHRFQMTVVQPTTTTFPCSSTQSTTESDSETTPPERRGAAQVVIIVIGVVPLLLLLLFVLTLILIYKRHSKNKRNPAAAPRVKEEYIYEEIQERPRRPDPRNAMNTIYTTVNYETHRAASLHYATINFQNGSGGEALITKPSCSACEYSTVKDSHSPTSSTVKQPSSEDPLYSTVNKPPKQ